MNVKTKFLGLGCAVVLCFASACSSVDSRVTGVILDRVEKDTQRTVEMAEKYSSPDVLRCAKYLQGATAGVRSLSNEPTEGIFSLAFKAALLRRLGQEYEDAFASECGAVAARLLVELGRRAPIPGVN